jgi:hypothetical protein
MHCRGEFFAVDPDAKEDFVRDPCEELMERANALLDSTALLDSAALRASRPR